MLRYELFDSDNDLLTYIYYLQKDERPGKVTINRVSGQTSVVEQAENDVGNRFAYKLLARLGEFYKEGTYQNKGFIAWH